MKYFKDGLDWNRITLTFLQLYTVYQNKNWADYVAVKVVKPQKIFNFSDLLCS